MDSSYPSKEKNAYTGPIELTGGETAICAVAVNDEGLVSTAVYGGYTVSGIKGKPTNSEFIAMIADNLSLKRKHSAVR